MQMREALETAVFKSATGAKGSTVSPVLVNQQMHGLALLKLKLSVPNTNPPAMMRG